jgi:hypothetical protein
MLKVRKGEKYLNERASMYLEVHFTLKRTFQVETHCSRHVSHIWRYISPFRPPKVEVILFNAFLHIWRHVSPLRRVLE